jgi:hypothetical protein
MEIDENRKSKPTTKLANTNNSFLQNKIGQCSQKSIDKHKLLGCSPIHANGRFCRRTCI